MQIYGAQLDSTVHTLTLADVEYVDVLASGLLWAYTGQPRGAAPPATVASENVAELGVNAWGPINANTAVIVPGVWIRFAADGGGRVNLSHYTGAAVALTVRVQPRAARRPILNLNLN